MRAACNRQIDPHRSKEASTMQHTRYRRIVLGFLFGCAATPALAAAAALPPLKVFKTPWCGCCTAWIDRMRAAGFTGVSIIEIENLDPVRRRLGIPDRYASCHTAEIQGYALEGHVPPADVRKLLIQRPVAAGLAVPGMPVGSPGMEVAGGRRDAFDTLLVLKSGGVRSFTRYARKPG